MIKEDGKLSKSEGQHSRPEACLNFTERRTYWKMIDYVLLYRGICKLLKIMYD